MRSIASLSAVSLLLLSACQPGSVSDQASSSSSSSSEEMMQISSDSSSTSSAFSEPIVIDLSSSAASVGASSAAAAASSKQAMTDTRVITVNVTDWSFSPAAINVKKGEKVQMKLVGGTGIHSFAVPGLNMNVRVEAGQTVVVDLPTGVAGTFDASCRIPCGPGHKDMKAVIVIS